MPIDCETFLKSSCFKLFYWLITMIALSSFLLLRREYLFTPETHLFDKAIFALWSIILFYPLVSEISIFGVSIKKQMDKLKEEVTSEIREIRLSLNNIAIMSANQRQQIVFQGFPRPSADNILDQRQANLELLLNREGMQVQPDADQLFTQYIIPDDMRVDERTSFLFNIRYALETEIKRIAESYLDIPTSSRLTIGRLVSNLRENELVEKDALNTIRELWAITSSAIHGDQVSEKQMDFVRNVTQGILVYLRSV